MKITAEQWSVLSQLFDQALELPQETRESWLESLSQLDAVLKDELRSLLERHALIETSDFLETLPKFSPAEAAAGDAAEPTALSAGTTVGPYVIEQEIGRGGMGVVWRARRADGLVKRAVALKLLHAGFYSSELLARFARERDILAALTHANIARLYDAGFTAAGQPFLALEFVEGLALTEYCDRNTLDIRARLQLMLQVLTAVQYAHSHLIVHRDLKPSNILVTSGGQIQLLDFGIAKLLAEEPGGAKQLTQFGGRVLTPDYASPEQIEGQPVSTASDVYSLGVVLYELLTGERPHRAGRRASETIDAARLAEETRRPSQIAATAERALARATTPPKLAAALRGDLDTIVLRALKAAPAERYATADALREDIDRYLHGRPVFARPDNAWYRARKFARRNRGPVAAAAAVVLALIIGAVAALWQARIARTEARTALVVQEFLRDIFRANSLDQADPEKGRQTTAAQLLDIGARKIDTSLQGAPQAKLRVVETLAQMYEELELTERAAVLYRKRIELARELFGADDPAVAAALIRLSVVLRASPSVEERDRSLREASRILDLNHDFTSRARGRLTLELADIVTDKDVARALLLTDQAVAINRAYPPDRDAVSAFIQQGILHTLRGELEEAERSYGQGLAALNAIRPPTNHDRSQLYTYLAQTQRELQKFSAAEASHREALRVAQIVGGPEHQLTLIAQLDLGWFLFMTGRRTEGLPMIRTATERIVATRGEDPQTIPWALGRYGRALLEFGRPEDANDVIARSILSLRAHRPGSGFLATALDFQARALVDLGRYSEATAALDEASHIHEAIHDSPAYINENIVSRTWLLLATGKAAEAERGIQSFAAQNARPGGASETSMQASLLRADIALAIGSFSAAGESASRVIDELQHSASRNFFSAYEARAAVIKGKALLASGEKKEALTWLERGISMSAAVMDASRSPYLADAEIALATCLSDLRQPDRAKLFAARARAILATHNGIGQQFENPLRELRRHVDLRP